MGTKSRRSRLTLILAGAPTLLVAWWSRKWFAISVGGSPWLSLLLSAWPQVASLVVLCTCAAGLARPHRYQRRLLMTTIPLLILFLVWELLDLLWVVPMTWQDRPQERRLLTDYDVELALVFSCIACYLTSFYLLLGERHRRTEKENT